MRKVKRTGLLLAMCMLITAVIYLTSDNKAQASDVIRPDEYYFVFNGQQKKAGTEYEMKNEEVLLNITAGTWEPATEVQWVSSEPGVVTLETTSFGSNFVKVVRKGPGYSTITAVVKHGTNTYTLSCLVKINLEFDYQKTGMTTATTTKERILVINNIDNIDKQIYLKYVNYTPDGEAQPVTGGAISASAVTWESDNESVATVDDKGKVKAVGSGSTRITVTTNTMSTQDRYLSISMLVVVAPRFSLTFDDANGNPVIAHSGNNNKSFIPVDGVPSNFILESNASYGTNLKWEVIDASTGKKPTSNKLTYSISENSGNVSFSRVKAGTYEIFAYANENYNYNTNAPYAYMKIIVPINLGNESIIMTVGDTYNIVDNSNIPNFGIFEIYYVEAGGSNIAQVNRTSGVITARRKGKVTIRLVYKTSSNLYDDDSVNVAEKTINVTVIDGISLSATEAMLYSSGTLLLQALVTDPTEPIIWSSDSPSIATVENGLVTAIRPGVAIITAMQNIQGVVKRATCEITVQQSVSSISIDPPVLNLAIGEYQTLHAKITPSSLSGVKLNWKTSDEKVVRIIEANPLTLTVQGVAGGNAVISAINEDNIVVGYSHVTIRQPVTRISLSETNVFINIDAKSIQLRAIVYPENALNKEVVWTSSNPQIARVNENGLVTLVKPGEVTIIARSADSPDVMVLCNVTIEVPVQTVSIDDKEVTMYVGQSQRLTYSVLPINATKNTVTWTSTKPNVASVDAAGRVTARQVGSTVIMLKTLDGGHTSYSTVTVRQIAEGIKFNKPEIEMETGQVLEMEYSLIPANATDSELVWESSDTKVVVVDELGKVTAKGPGIAFVIARTEAGGMSYVKVTVKQPVSGILLNFSEKTIYVRESFDLKASVSPSGASNLAVEWKSSNDKVAAISNTGEVIGISAGMAIITATTKDGGKTANCVVTVRERITSMKLSYEEYRLGIDKSFTLSVIVENETATDQQFRWVSSNSSIASVNKNGKVTGHRLGYATITAYAQDGSGQDASCEVEIVRPVTRVTLDKSFLTLFVGETKELKAKIEPGNASYKRAIWSSSDNSVAMVDEDGMITALKAGSVTITAEAQDNSGKKAVSFITVNNRVPATSIVLSDKKVVMIQGEQRDVKPVLNPVSSTDGLTWSSDNNAVASVNKSSGRIKANATGTAYITAMTDSGKTASIEITVIGLNVTKLELEQYSEYTLVVEGATSRVTWDIANPAIAVIRNGRVSTRATGTTTITATVNGRKLTCKLTVTKIR
ncbi:MAG: hypothetical protein EWM47_04600 [Anaerolineaceae bacterium]|nr:MAG: hypothetical protein EWM47_04600 [Anaerolineaceae bacterium]